MKDYLFMLMSIVGFFIVFFTVEFCEMTTINQLFLSLGVIMMWFPIPIDLILDMYEEKKKEEK